MYKVVWTSDTHLGLKTNGFDRTDEIISIYKQVAEHAKKIKADAIVLGGDIFDSSEPNEYLISKFLMILNLLSSLDLTVYVMAGNHESVEDPKRVTCFSFLKKIKKKYKNVKLIDDIKSIEPTESNIGKIHFTFLPHINSALMHKKGLKLKPQDYIDKLVSKIRKRVKKGDQHYVFSHLNVRGVEPASEKYLMKKSTVYIPEELINESSVSKDDPQIIQGHIHSSETVGNINIIGSPLFCGFGEKESEKYFIDMEIPTDFGEEFKINYQKTRCCPFREIHIDLLKKFTGKLTEFPKIKEFLESLEKNSVVKFSVNITPENAVYDWEEFRNYVMKEYELMNVFPITPKIVRDKKTRNPAQKPKIPHDKAIKMFVKDGHRKDKEKVLNTAMRVFEVANADS